MAEEIRFIKMEGAGNDYVYVDGFSQYVPGPQAFARRVSDRHFGVGSDGVIFMKPSKRADCFMDIYNADGSRGRTCGNGLRCVAMYMWEKSGRTKEEITIETLSGICRARPGQLKGRKCWVSVTMGRAFCRDMIIPRHDISKMLPGGVFVDWARLVDAGNLHCVVMLKCFEQDSLPEDVLQSLDLKAIGSFLENYRGFPGSVNVELCMEDTCQLSMHALRARVWERGSGETLACGSGACAIYRAAADQAKDSEREQCGKKGAPFGQCCIFMPGGRLCVLEEDGELVLSGEAARVFEGKMSW